MERQNTTLYIDAANLIISSRKYLNTECNIIELLVYLKDRYRASKCIYFTGKIQALLADYELFRSLGIEVVFKEIYREDNKTKANCDVEISHRITLDIENKLVDKCVLVSGDGDFASLLDYCLIKNVKPTLFSVCKASTSRMLRNRRYLNLTYYTDVLNSLKGKGPTGHVVQAGRLFDNSSITQPQNLSISSEKDRFISVYVTFKDRDQAEDMVKSLLEKKLIACANYLNIEANYFWKGQLANEKEVACFLKSKLENWENIKNEVIKLHSYEIPCIIKYEVESNQSYSDWVKSETNLI